MKQPMTSLPNAPSLPQANNGSIDTATLDLLASWRLQDATTDAEELRAAEQEVADFKKAINENRTIAGEPVLYP